MRRGYSSRRRKKRIGFDSVAFGVLIIAVLYLVATGLAGKWVARYVISPVAGVFEKASTTTTNPKSTASASLTASMKSISLYLLQTGAFSQESSAETEAAVARARGGAGYILHDGLYRIMDWGSSSESAARVSQQSLKAQGIECSVYNLKTNSVTLRLSGKEGEVSALKSALEQWPTLCGRMMTICDNLSGGTIGVEAARTNILQLVDDMGAINKQLSAISSGDQNTYVQKMSKLYQSFGNALKALGKTDGMTKTTASSRAKFYCLDMYRSYAVFVSELS